jgi:hypothetical protein
MKHSQSIKPQKENVFVQNITPKEEVTPVKENKIDENKSVMTTEEKIAMAQAALNGTPASPVKRVKKDKGLIERTESSKTILTEDNKELLND